MKDSAMLKSKNNEGTADYLLAENKPARVDMQYHNGLRGLTATWIMVFHCILFSKLQWNLQGSSIMPLFFILSGFSLAVAYGKPHSDVLESGEMIDSYAFYRNRFARVMPIYYLTFAAAIPLCFFGFGTISFYDMRVLFYESLVTNIIPVNTLFSFLLGAPIDGPAWTISTLVVFWAFFPFSLYKSEQLSDKQLTTGIVACFYVQLFLLLVLFFALLLVSSPLAFYTATMNPITRFPIFLMGVFAGILCRRHPDDFFEWIPSVLFFPMCCSCKSAEKQPPSNLDFWATRSNVSSIILLIFTVIFSVLESMGYKVFGEVYLQAVVPFSQLEVVVGITRDNCSSVASKVFDYPLWQHLGTIGMTIYLIHWVLISYLAWAVRGHPLDWVNCTKDVNRQECVDWNDSRQIPNWGIPVVIAATLLLAFPVYYYIEEPCRKLLQVRKNRA